MISHLIEHNFFYLLFLINRNSLEVIIIFIWGQCTFTTFRHTHTHTHIQTCIFQTTSETGYSREFIDIYISDYKH